jgi:hypothetical protein
VQILLPFWIYRLIGLLCLCRRRSGQSGSRPEASPLDFVIRPQSKIDPEQIRARAKQAVQDQHRMKVIPAPTSNHINFLSLLFAR